jgi:type II secretory ATPase GspE/PulE/Tfp pilus assembly ATPase PilB-like protein
VAESATISSRVLDSLVNSGLLTIEQLTSIREAAESSGTTPGAALIERGLVTSADLANVLEEELGIPAVDLESYAPDEEALVALPADRARALNMLPLFEIEGMLTVAIGDAVDVFKLDGLAEELGLEVEAVLAEASAVTEAIGQYYGDAPAAPVVEDIPGQTPAVSEAPAPATSPESVDQAPIPTELPIDIIEEEPMLDAADFFEAPVGDAPVPVVAEAISLEEPALPDEVTAAMETIEEVVEATPEGPAAVDLDVLAVADPGKIAILVTEILEHAVARSAQRIHILPYKNDFFLVYRVMGRLERVASAPISMQAALIDGFKNFAKVGSVPPDLPALGRVKARVADKDLTITVSSVPTVAGQRMVISLSAGLPEPRSLEELGMTDAESRALHAMVERGRGILLVAAPVAGGRSSTYYALLAQAARVGKTVYSVERAIDYEIPAVSQVLVNPGSSVGAESYFSAGIAQDTDVMAIDAVQTVEEIHLAIEAAGLGKLVIATFSGGGIVAGVSRMLDLGVEPVSLAAALTLGVGQRLVRVNCPNCSQEADASVLSTVPGAKPGLSAKAGAGCANCGNSGYMGATGIFEVLPFTESVRATIARGGSEGEIGAAAQAAGMRPMIASGLAKVEGGRVSPVELNRVLRFSE